jgi:lipopolysaccharide exporter
MYTQAKLWIRHSRSQVNQLLLSRTYFSLFWGYAGMFCLNMLAYPLLTRIYEPQAFGELAVYRNTVLILSGVGALSLEKAIVLAKSRARALNLVYVSVGVLAVFSLFSGLIFLLFYEPLAALLEISGPLRYFWFLLPFVIFSAGIYQIAFAGLLRKAAFQELSLFRFLLRALTLAFQAGLLVFLGARYGLIIGFMSGFLLLFLILFFRYAHLMQSFRLSLGYCKQSWQRFSDIPRYSFPQSLFYHISSRIPFFMAAALFSLSDVGYFSVAYGLLSLPEALIAAAIADMFFQKISSAESQIGIKKILLQYWSGLLFIGIIPFGILFCYGEGMAVFLMGEGWRSTGKMLSMMAPMFLFTFISTPTSSTLTVIRRQKWELVYGMASFIIRPLSFYVGYLMGEIMLAMALWGGYEMIQLTVYNLMVYRMLCKGADFEVVKYKKPALK